ncbi:Transcription initiation factor TFIID subunit 9B [Nosema bombycis CQ1]|uniref:Transcription initiation factor TFIID subunit 9B n=1 Tax=Nosema bombycis (strain CQ1 / CVCC 102059) TaxID=578461 RepID=R0M315_NOSB1|nr:Transcription initiation factor TFIID subunit 9B [Nosema bombycis CQ1]|eukprot:EOB12379.1 Transcription initiation factor TFIID subunit 9B [Nosema bombycis CQ1]
MPPQNENLAPRDAKVISLIIRSLGIEVCEPKFITQLLELSYKYATDVLIDARRYSEHCERTSIGVNDIKLSLQSKVGKYFVPPPPRQYLLDIANVVNAKPLSVSEGENLVRVPGRNIFNLNYDYEIIEKGEEKKRKMY